METQLPQTPPISPAMRQTLGVLSWVLQGLANADRARRERLAGGKDVTGEDALHVFLKENGIDVPRFDAAVRTLLQNRHTAETLKDMASMVADVAQNPPDLGAFVQRFAQVYAGAPAASAATPPPPSAPVGSTWTRTKPAAGPAKYRWEFTSEARRTARSDPRAPDPSPPPPSSEAPATDSKVPVDPKPRATAATTTTTPTTSSPSAAITPAPSPADTLAARMDAFEARAHRELAELRRWMHAKFEELQQQVRASQSKQSAMQTELDSLRTRVDHLESLTRPVAAAPDAAPESSQLRLPFDPPAAPASASAPPVGDTTAATHEDAANSAASSHAAPPDEPTHPPVPKNTSPTSPSGTVQPEPTDPALKAKFDKIEGHLLAEFADLKSQMQRLDAMAHTVAHQLPPAPDQPVSTPGT